MDESAPRYIFFCSVTATQQEETKRFLGNEVIFTPFQTAKVELPNVIV